MKSYLDCWISTARVLFSQALAGEPRLEERDSVDGTSEIGFVAEITGDMAGFFNVGLDSRILDSPLHGDGVNQLTAWSEFLREVAEAAAGELHASSGLSCRVGTFRSARFSGSVTQAFELSCKEHSWFVVVRDEVHTVSQESSDRLEGRRDSSGHQSELSRGVELLLDVELEAALRFGCREMPLGEILELGPGDVVELDRHISDPVDLVVGDKIIAKGDVVLVNGNFSLRVTEVAEPQRRLESIRCLF